VQADYDDEGDDALSLENTMLATQSQTDAAAAASDNDDGRHTDSRHQRDNDVIAQSPDTATHDDDGKLHAQQI